MPLYSFTRTNHIGSFSLFAQNIITYVEVNPIFAHKYLLVGDGNEVYKHLCKSK